MLSLNDLRQFAAFGRLGTLSKVADEFYISQPTITRTMKRVEEAFGVPLFHRSSNQIELNETGKKAMEYAAELLKAEENAISQVLEFDRRLHTIIVESCAPAPLWSLLPALSKKHEQKAISSILCDSNKIVEDVKEGKCAVGILPFPLEQENIYCQQLMEEHLSICVPPSHDLAKYKTVTCGMINGYNCLLTSEIGFWSEVCRRKMPASKFLVQTDEFAFLELIKESSLPCFITDLVPESQQTLCDRIAIPITDDEVNVTYYFICTDPSVLP